MSWKGKRDKKEKMTEDKKERQTQREKKWKRDEEIINFLQSMISSKFPKAMSWKGITGNTETTS